MRLIVRQLVRCDETAALPLHASDWLEGVTWWMVLYGCSLWRYDNEQRLVDWMAARERRAASGRWEQVEERVGEGGATSLEMRCVAFVIFDHSRAFSICHLLHSSCPPCFVDRCERFGCLVLEQTVVRTRRMMTAVLYHNGNSDRHRRSCGS